MINGIGHPVSTPDLLDRSIVLELPRIDERDYVPEADLLERFRSAHPGALGLLLDGVSHALADGADSAVPARRTADAARWVATAGPALGWPHTGAASFAAGLNRAVAMGLGRVERALLLAPEVRARLGVAVGEPESSTPPTSDDLAELRRNRREAAGL